MVETHGALLWYKQYMTEDSPWRGLTSIRVNIGKRNFNWWSIDHNLDRTRYASGLNPGIIKYKLDAYMAVESQHRITALRQLQHESSEFLFALMGAYWSGVDTIPAWMTLYENSDVEEFSKHIMSGKGREDYLELMNGLIDDDAIIIKISGIKPNRNLVLETIYLHLKSIFKDYSDMYAKAEYTSTKHSYRVTGGDSRFRISFDGETYHDLIGGDQSVSHVSSKRLSREVSFFEKRDVAIYHSSTTYSLDYVRHAIELIHQLSQIFVQCIKHKLYEVDPKLELHLASHKDDIYLERAFRGNGRIVEGIKRFKRDDTGMIYTTFSMDMSMERKASFESQFFSNCNRPQFKDYNPIPDLKIENFLKNEEDADA